MAQRPSILTQTTTVYHTGLSPWILLLPLLCSDGAVLAGALKLVAALLSLSPSVGTDSA